MSMIERFCSNCGASVKRYSSQFSNPDRTFCNRTCQGAYRSRHARGAQAANWQGGSRKSGAYVEVYAPWASCANQRGYAPLHRLVMELTLGRALRPDEIVHHIDGDSLNNDPGNLRVMSQSEHARLHGAQRSADELAAMRAAKRGVA